MAWRAGEPICGVIEQCGSESSGLVGWAFCSHQEWSLASGDTFVSSDQADADIPKAYYSSFIYKIAILECGL